MTECLGIFAKNWASGNVKTRLARSIGEQKAAEIYRIFVETLIERFSDISTSKVLAFTPSGPESQSLFSSNQFSTWEKKPQIDGDLGKRMSFFFEAQFSKGLSKIVLIGSDSPNLPHKYVDQAFQSLRSHDVVLGPSNDGGYYLVGCKKQVSQIFRDIPWSTEHVWQNTIERLEKESIEYKVLEPWYDVDDWDDLQKLVADLNSDSVTDPILIRLREKITEILAES